MFQKLWGSRVITDEKTIDTILSRGVRDVFIKENLRVRLLSGKRLRIKFGIDPTGPTVHLGRAIPLRKLRAFQDLGHQIVLIIGDFTAMIGDPSDKLEKRPMLTRAKIEENMRQYKKILGAIVDINKTEFVYNSRWLEKLRFEEIATLAEAFSVPQMSARRNFKDRLEKGEEVSLREFLYPLMQGYDSVAVQADIEISGFDQLFNLKAGRIIQKHYHQIEQDVLATEMLPGTDGRKMSTSWGNVINITDHPSDMFGKVMSLKDELISTYFLLCTDRTLSEIEAIKQGMERGENPRDFKMKLASDIVTLYHGKDEASKAEENFKNTFQKGGIPDEVKEVGVKTGELLSEILLKEGLVKSKAEFRRLVEESAVSDFDSKEKITDPFYKLTKSASFKIGARRFLKVKVLN